MMMILFAKKKRMSLVLAQHKSVSAGKLKACSDPFKAATKGPGDIKKAIAMQERRDEHF